LEHISQREYAGTVKGIGRQMLNALNSSDDSIVIISLKALTNSIQKPWSAEHCASPVFGIASSATAGNVAVAKNFEFAYYHLLRALIEVPEITGQDLEKAYAKFPRCLRGGADGLQTTNIDVNNLAANAK
jgi:hypothetical protein